MFRSLRTPLASSTSSTVFAAAGRSRNHSVTSSSSSNIFLFSSLSSSSSAPSPFSCVRCFHSRTNTNIKVNDGGMAWTVRDAFLETADQLSPELGSDRSLSLLARPGSKKLSAAEEDFKYHISSSSKGGGAAGSDHRGGGASSGAAGSTVAAAAAFMDQEDVLIRTETALRWYNPAAYSWLMLPSVDLIDVMVMKGVVPRDHPQTHIARWFAAPEDVVYYPAALKDILGHGRYNIVAPEIGKLLRDYEEGVSPLLRALRKHPELPRDIWVALTRWMAVMASRAEAKDTILALTLAISNGQGPQSLQLPEMQQHRGAIVGDILIGAGAEYGAVSLAQLGVDLLLINGKTCTFQDQKTLTVAFSRTSARLMDWSVRCSGELLRCLPRWMEGHVAVATASALNSTKGVTDKVIEQGKHTLLEQLRKGAHLDGSDSDDGAVSSSTDAAGAPAVDEDVEVVGGVSDLTDEEQRDIFEKMADAKDGAAGTSASSAVGAKGKHRSKLKELQAAPGSLEELEELDAAASASRRTPGVGPEDDDDVDGGAPVALVDDTVAAKNERLLKSIAASKNSIFFDDQQKQQQQHQSLVSDPTWRYFKSDDDQKQTHSGVRKALLRQSTQRQAVVSALPRAKGGRPKKNTV